MRRRAGAREKNASPRTEKLIRMPAAIPDQTSEELGRSSSSSPSRRMTSKTCRAASREAPKTSSSSRSSCLSLVSAIGDPVVRSERSGNPTSGPCDGSNCRGGRRTSHRKYARGGEPGGSRSISSASGGGASSARGQRPRPHRDAGFRQRHAHRNAAGRRRE